jgi:formiminotetrahydrofolate cyclodeaminase
MQKKSLQHKRAAQGNGRGARKAAKHLKKRTGAALLRRWEALGEEAGAAPWELAEGAVQLVTLAQDCAAGRRVITADEMRAARLLLAAVGEATACIAANTKGGAM